MLPNSGLSNTRQNGYPDGYVVEKTFINFVDSSPLADGAQSMRRVCSDGAIYEKMGQELNCAQWLDERSDTNQADNVEYEMTGLSDCDLDTENRTSLVAACHQYFQEVKDAELQKRGSVTCSTCSTSSHGDGEATISQFLRVTERDHLIAENARLALENDLLRENMRLAAENTKLKATAATRLQSDHATVVDNGQNKVGNAHTGERTTVMWRNLPNNYNRSMLLSLLDSSGFARLYDFAYLPIDFKTGACLGYAFINLISEDVVRAFWAMFDGYSRWDIPSKKASYVSWSEPHQGFAVNVERYRNSPVMHDSVPDEYKPIVLVDGVRMAFPAPSKKTRPPRCRESNNTARK